MTIHPVEAPFFHADGQTYMTKLMFAFRNFANMPKNQLKYKDVDTAIL
jgi:bacillopeptidase F (M6 metalloprotease family)